MKRLMILLAVLLLASVVLVGHAGATVPFIVKGTAQNTNPANINQSANVLILNPEGIGTIPRGYINTTEYNVKTFTYNAPAGDDFLPSLTFTGAEQAANITVVFLDGEQASFWIYKHQSGWYTDSWITLGSGSLSVSKWEFLTLNQDCYQINAAKVSGSGSGAGSWTGSGYGFVFHRITENWEVVSAISGGASATGIRSITVSSRNNVSLEIKLYGATSDTGENQNIAEGGNILQQITDMVTNLITLLTDVIGFVMFIAWFVVFFITNLPLLVVDLEALIILISCSTGRDRIEMGVNFVHYNSVLTTVGIGITRGLIASVAPAIQAVAAFAQAGAVMAQTVISGITGGLAALIAFIFA